MFDYHVLFCYWITLNSTNSLKNFLLSSSRLPLGRATPPRAPTSLDRFLSLLCAHISLLLSLLTAKPLAPPNAQAATFLAALPGYPPKAEKCEGGA